MFELDDSKLGKVKLVSVTEARQHISTIMQDFGVHYVITKNSKPVRMIVDYDAFKQTKPSELPETEKQAPALEAMPRAFEAPKAQKVVVAKPKTFEPESDEPKPVLKTKKIKFPDIFHSHPEPRTTTEPESTETDLAQPETTVENIENRLHSTEQTNQVWETEKTIPDNENWIIESDNETTTRDFKDEETQPLEEMSFNPEKEAYFKRFRKLYEPLSKARHIEDQGDYWKNDDITATEPDAPSESGQVTLSSTEEDFKITDSHKNPPSPDQSDPPSIEDILKALEDEKL